MSVRRRPIKFTLRRLPNVKPDPRPTMSPLAAAGTARPALPVSVFAEDFSLLIRTPRRYRIARSKIRVLS